MCRPASNPTLSAWLAGQKASMAGSRRLSCTQLWREPVRSSCSRSCRARLRTSSRSCTQAGRKRIVNVHLVQLQHRCLYLSRDQHHCLALSLFLSHCCPFWAHYGGPPCYESTPQAIHASTSNCPTVSALCANATPPHAQPAARRAPHCTFPTCSASRRSFSVVSPRRSSSFMASATLQGGRAACVHMYRCNQNPTCRP